MPTNLLQISSHSCLLTRPVLLRPRGGEPGRVIDDQWLRVPSVHRAWGHGSGHLRSYKMIIFGISYSEMVSDKVTICSCYLQREIRREKFVSPGNLGRDSVFASGVLFRV